MGHNSNQSVYAFDAFSSQGRHQVSKGNVGNDTWVWTSEAHHGGQKISTR